MKVKPFEEYMVGVLKRDASPDIAKVQTFAEADYTDKPAGIVVTMKDQSQVFLQFVSTAPPGGDVDHEDYKIPEGRL